MKPADLLAAARAAQGIPSNGRLAAVLNVPDKSVQRWNVGRGAPDDATAARLAQLAGIDPDAAVASMHAWRAHDEGERARWQRIADRLAQAPAAAAAAVILALWTGGPPDAVVSSLAAAAAAVDSGVTPYTLSPVALALALLCAGFSRRARGR